MFLHAICYFLKFVMASFYVFVSILNNLSPINCTMFPLNVTSLFIIASITGAVKMRLKKFHFNDIKISEYINLTKLCFEIQLFDFAGNPVFSITYDVDMIYFEIKLFSLVKFKCWIPYVR